MILNNVTSNLINATTQSSIHTSTQNPEDNGISYNLLASCLIILAVLLPLLLIVIARCCRRFCSDGLYFGYMKVYTLPKRIFHEESTDCKICTLCAVEYIDGDSLRALPCNHLFHGPCLRNYGRRYRSERCPICLELIYPDQTARSNNRFAVFHTAKDPLICDDGTPRPSYGTTLVY